MTDHKDPFFVAASAEEKKIVADEKKAAEVKKAAAENPAFTDSTPTEAEKDSAKSAEEVRLRALQTAKDLEVQKAQALKDSEAAAKKVADDNAVRAKKLHEDDEVRQREAEASNKRIDQKLRERRAEKEKQKSELLEEASVILKEYNGAEANIPVSSGYWAMMNTYRGLQKDLDQNPLR